MQDLEQKFIEWRAGCPLKVWRDDRGVSIATIAAGVGVSSNMVIRWESGSSTPSDASMDSLARLMNIKPKELIQNWEAWISAALVIK